MIGIDVSEDIDTNKTDVSVLTVITGTSLE